MNSKRQEEYIRKRFEALEEQGYRRGLEAYGELERNYGLAKTEIEKTILYWLRRLAANNNISTAEARRLLDADELKEFKWSADEYAEKARNNSDGRWQKELENASAKVHIRLYEAINISLKNVTNDLMQKNSETIKKGLSEIYENTYYKAGYEIQKESGRLGTFAAADKRVIEKAIEKPWTADGKTFSERLWKEQDKLVSAVDSVINKGLMTGSGGDRMIAELADRIVKDLGLEIDKAKKRARTIVRTETSRIHNQASLDSMKETGCEYCKISETLDMITCEYCGSKDGKVIKVSEAVAGGNAPPLHPNCRGCAIPYFDSPHMKDGSKRAARDPETGKTVLVENMSYKEWKEKYVKENGQEAFDLKYKSAQNLTADKEQYKKYKSVLGKNAPKSLEEFQKIKYNDSSKWSYYKGAFKYMKSYPESSLEYYNIKIELDKQGYKIGTPLKPVFTKAYIMPSGKKDSYHIMKRMLERNITDDDVRSYVSSAKCMFSQWGGARLAYYSNEGVSVVDVKGEAYKTAWSKYDFDEATKLILEVCDKYVK